MLTSKQIQVIKKWLKYAKFYRFIGKVGCRKQLALFNIDSEIGHGFLCFYEQKIKFQKHPIYKKRGLWVGRLVIHLTLEAGLLVSPVLLIDPDSPATIHFCKKLWDNI